MTRVNGNPWQPIETFDAADKEHLWQLLVWVVLPDGEEFWAEAWPDEDGRPIGSFAYTIGWEGWRITHWMMGPERPAAGKPEEKRP